MPIPIFCLDNGDRHIPPYMLPDAPLVLEDWRMHRYDVGEHYFKDHIDSHDLIRIPFIKEGV